MLVKGGDRSLPEAMMMLIPEAWQDNDSLSPAKRAFYQYHSCLMEPRDGACALVPVTPPPHPTSHFVPLGDNVSPQILP